MDTDERALLHETVVSALRDTTDADAVLADLGWRDLLAEEPTAAIAVVGEALGATNQTAGVLDDVMTVALGATPSDELAVVLPSFGRWDAPNRTGLATRRATSALAFLVGTDALPSSAVAIQPISGIDPDADLYRVETTGATAPHATRWETAVAHGRGLLAYETLGACRAMLDLARTHALDRVQFDRPIASFQAVRHRLAEALVAIEALAATLEAAADEPNATTALLAKATAGRTARTVATHCQQVLAGIGFTTEHPFHRYLKRTMLLDGLLGRADDLVVVAGRELLAMRRVPTLIEL
jgi:hypothetical protein